MRSRVAWLIGLAGLVAFLRRRRPRAAAVEPVGDSPADELRRKLDEVRGAPAAETPAAGLGERRRQVHDAGRAVVDEMRREPPTSEE